MTDVYKSVFIGNYASVVRGKFTGKEPYLGVKATEFPINPVKKLIGGFFGLKVTDVPVMQLDGTVPIIDVKELDPFKSEETGRYVRFVFADLMWNRDYRIQKKIPAVSGDLLRLHNVEAERDRYKDLWYDLIDKLPEMTEDEAIKSFLKLLDYAKEARKRQMTPADWLRESGR